MPANRSADVIDFEDARGRVLEQRAKDRGVPPLALAYLSCVPGEVRLRFTDGDELVMTPDQARVWAERFACWADTAEAMSRDVEVLLDPEGGGRG